MHVAQINFLPAPVTWEPLQLLERWPSLADIADAVASADVRVSVLQLAAYAAHVRRNNVDYYFVDVAGADDVASLGRRIAKQLEGMAVDVLHVHGLAFAAEAFAVSIRLPQLPILFQDHADRPPRWWRRPQWRRWYAAAAGAAFTNTELARPFSRAGLLPRHIPLFAIPESSSRFTPGNRSLARAETGLYGDPCVLWVGHLNAGKDPLTVLDGVANATNALPGLHLWCAFGSAPLQAEVVRQVASDPRLLGRVHLLGKVSHERIQSLMRAADLFVSGSRGESCGYALLEALACGTVPVVTDIPAFRSLTGEGRVGQLWPCGNAQALARALQAASMRPQTPAQVRTYFDSTLSFEAVGRQWADVYAQLQRSLSRRVG